jgi:hypothetical protein
MLYILKQEFIYDKFLHMLDLFVVTKIFLELSFQMIQCLQ